ncbi:MAG: Asp-tRNA(Asn) amidotransferase GatCAB subunit C [Candidatus Altiarchaeia archaeon]|jgi:predicted Asp-tRNA(Asn)/Glu-tRNA(Gln) amidotransferase subunit C
MLDKEKIRTEGVALLEEFSKELESVPETSETHYVLDVRNVCRKDGPGVKAESFPTDMKKIVPRWEEGYVVSEKGV